MQDLKFRLMLDLISTVGARASQEGRQFEDAQRRMSDSTDRTASRFERLSRLTAGWGNDSSTERQVRWMEKLGQAVDQAHNKFQGLKRSLSAGLDKLPEIGMAVGAGAYAAKRVGLPPLQAFASLEEAVTELRMAMLRRDGTVGSGFDAISRAAIELGAKLPGTTKDFMSSAVALKQQGMPDEAILKGGLRAAGGFGVLMNMNQGEAATAIAKMREAYGVPDSQLYGMADLMQRGRYAFGIDPSDFKAVATYAAPTFNQLGLRGLGTAKELLAVQGMAASVGLEASSFGTNFADMLRRLSQVTGRQNRNSEQAREVRRTLKEAGVDLEFYNKKGEFAGVENMMGQLGKLRPLSTLQRQRVLDALFGAEAGRPAQILAQNGLEGYREAMAKIDSQASLDQRLNLKVQTLTSTVDALSGSFENLLATVGKPVGTAAKPALNTVNGWLGATTDWMSDHPGVSAGTFAAGTAGASWLAMRGTGALLGRFGFGGGGGGAAGVRLGSFGTVSPGAFPPIDGMARSTSWAARAAGVGSFAARATPWALAGIGAYDVLSDDQLTTAGKLNGLGRVGAQVAGGTAGWKAGAAGGAAIGTFFFPGVGTAVGGVLGGGLGALAGSWGGGKVYDYFSPPDPARDIVAVTGPNGQIIQGANGAAMLEIGEGRLSVEVRVADDRVGASTTVMQSMPMIRIDAGSTDPGSFSAGGRY